MRGLLIVVLSGCLVVAEAAPIRAQPNANLSSANEVARDNENASGAFSSRALQREIKAQRERIETLISTVQALTVQLQRILPAAPMPPPPVEEAATTEEAQEPILELPSGAPLELRQSQLAFAKLRQEEKAVQAAQKPKQMQKQLELQRKQIEVLNKMVKLLAEQLQKQGPVVSKLETDAATLESRSKQGAQRDQELANYLDNLTEQMDARQRYPGRNIPANLKQWFLPSGTNETPFSIYNALLMRYNYFPSSKMPQPFQSGGGQFQFIEYDPILLLQLNKRVLFESQLEIHTDGLEPEFAQFDWMVTDWLTVVGGRYLTPIGTMNERLHFSWINKMADYPIFSWAVVPFDFNLNGAQLRGSTYLFGSPVKLEYAFYAANGLGVPGNGTVTDFVNIVGQTDSSKTINNAIAYGGRVALWVPAVGFNGGVSYFGNRPYTAGVDAAKMDIWDIDLNYHYGNWDVRFEAAQTFQNTTPFIGNNILLQGLYAQIAYRPYNVANRYLQKTEVVYRYSVFRGSGYTPDQLDFTQFTFANQMPISRNQYAFDINYYPYPSMALKLEYEINREIGANLHDDALLAEFAWGF